MDIVSIMKKYRMVRASDLANVFDKMDGVDKIKFLEFIYENDCKNFKLMGNKIKFLDYKLDDMFFVNLADGGFDNYDVEMNYLIITYLILKSLKTDMHYDVFNTFVEEYYGRFGIILDKKKYKEFVADVIDDFKEIIKSRFLVDEKLKYLNDVLHSGIFGNEKEMFAKLLEKLNIPPFHDIFAKFLEVYFERGDISKKEIDMIFEKIDKHKLFYLLPYTKELIEIGCKSHVYKLMKNYLRGDILNMILYKGTIYRIDFWDKIGKDLVLPYVCNDKYFYALWVNMYMKFSKFVDMSKYDCSDVMVFDLLDI